MLVPAALVGPAPKAGVVVLSLLVAVVLLAGDRRRRAAAMLASLVLAPVLLLADIWHSPQLTSLHRHPSLVVAALVVLALVLTGAVRWLHARAWLVAPLTIAALPFRVPIQAGGTTSNLLVPLYAVLLAGALVYLLTAWRRGEPDGATGWNPEGDVAPGWLARLLALSVVLYAIQATYSSDFEKALQQMVFFYAPFALVFCLLRELTWTPRLLRVCLILVAALAVVFAFIGFAEYATKTIILNPKLVVQNDLHTYFTVNSVFFDPDIFGRFLALVMVMLAAVLLSLKRSRDALIVAVVLAILWAGLVLTLSRSSLGALLLGLIALAALRWRARLTIAVAVIVVVIGAIALVVSPKTFGLNQGLNGASSGRAGLVSGGVHMFSERLVWGYGSGSFVTRYREEHPTTAQTLAASHTIAVTVAAEQGLIGEIVYIALVLVALATLLRHARGDPARMAIGAAFLALVLHTNLYADFLEDPMTWTLLAIGAALAAQRPRPPRSARRHERPSGARGPWYKSTIASPRTRSAV